MVALGARQPVGADHPRGREAQVATQPPSDEVTDLGDVGRALTRPQPHDGHDRHPLGRRRRDAPAAGGAQPLGHLAEHEPGRRRVAGEHVVEGLARDLQQGGVATGAHRGRARLAGEQGELPQHLARPELAHDRLVDEDLEAPRAHGEGRPGRVALGHQHGTGRQLDRTGRALQTTQGVRGQGGEQWQVGEVDGIVRAQPRRDRPVGRGIRREHHRGPLGDDVLVLDGRPDATERERQHGDDDERDDREHPALVQRRDDGGGAGVTEDHDEDRDAEHPAELARARRDRGCRRVPAAGNSCERRAAEKWERGAHADAAEHLPRHPLGPEGRLEADPLVVPEVGRGPHERTRDHEDAVAVPFGQGSEPRGHQRGDDGTRHEGQAGTQHVVAPDVLQPQHVRQQVGVEPEARGHGCGRTEVERP